MFMCCQVKRIAAEFVSSLRWLGQPWWCPETGQISRELEPRSFNGVPGKGSGGLIPRRSRNM